MSARNSDSRNFRFDWDNDGGLLVIMIMVIIMLGVAVACSLWIVNTGRIDYTQGERGIVLDRKVDNRGFGRDRRYEELNRKLLENRLLIAETQATLQFLMRGLTIRVVPKERAESSTAPSPNDGQIAPKAP